MTSNSAGGELPEPRPRPRPGGDMIRVELQVCEAFFMFARRRACEDGYLNAADYLNGMLNMAVLEDMDWHDEPVDRSWPGESGRYVPEPGDLDDGIPF